jgi:hypothetical protein
MKNKNSGQEIFQNRDANLKRRNKHENFEDKKHIIGCTSRTE